MRRALTGEYGRRDREVSRFQGCRRVGSLRARWIVWLGMLLVASSQGCIARRGSGSDVRASPRRNAVPTHTEVAFIRPGQDRVFHAVGVAARDEGGVHVLDEATGLVKEFSPQGEYVRDFRVAEPWSLGAGVTVSQCLIRDRAGNLLVSDARQGMFHTFAPTGQFLGSVRLRRGGSHPVDGLWTAVDSRGNTYVAIHPGPTIRKLDRQGRLLWDRALDTEGAGPLSDHVAAISVDTGDQVWVWVHDSEQVFVFQPDGRCSVARSSQTWGNLVAACFDRHGNRYELWFETVAGYGTDLVKFDPHGKELWRHNWSAVAGTGISVSQSGTVFVAMQDFKFTAGPCVEVSQNGEEVRVIGSNGTRPGEIRDPSGLAADAAGNLYVGDYYTGRLQRFGPDGSFLSTIAGPDIPDSSAQRIETEGGVGPPTSIALGPDGRIYVTHDAPYSSDPENMSQTASVFSQSGALVREYDSLSLGYGFHTNMHFGASPVYPASIAIDSQGHIWSAIGLDTEMVERQGRFTGELRGRGVRVAKYGRSGKLLFSIGGHGTEPGKFGRLGVFDGSGVEGISASLLAVGDHDSVWVVDWGNDRLQRFDQRGRFVAQIGPNVGERALARPWGVAADGRRHLYVADEKGILEFTADGALAGVVAVWGSDGSVRRDEHVCRYRGIAVDSSRNVYITDAASESVRKFVPRATAVSSGTSCQLPR
jgi:sugar lactone lactonase YvrE